MINTYGKILHLCFLFSHILLCADCNGQQNKCDSSFKQFRKDILFELEEHNGSVVWDDQTQESQCILMLTCEVKDLFDYSDDAITAVRCEIFSALAQKNADPNRLSAILNKYATDTSKFTSNATDVVITWTASEYMQSVFDAKVNKKLNTIDYQGRLRNLHSKLQIIIAGERHGHVAKDSLLHVDSLFCSVDEFTITSFTLYARKKASSTNSALTKRMKRLLRKLEPGEKVYFDNLTVEASDKSTRKLAPLALIID